MLGKLLLLVLSVVCLVGWLRGARRAPPAPARAAEPSAPQVMVRCAHCGLHLPESEGLMHDGQAYCSWRHRLAGARPPAARRP
ncbi:MAG: hypothetical protein RLZZ592_174 [Pseudomonadota bacterium]|jgi:uncharacterized protein|nr:uncharacterized protein [Pseudomonadota bacterium]